MSQNDEYLNRRGVTNCSCYCPLMFHFDNVSMSSTALAVQNINGKPFKCNVFVVRFCLHPYFMWPYNWRFFLSPLNIPETIVIKPFHPQKRAWEGTEKVLSSCSINLPICPSYKHFSPTPCFVHRVHTKPPAFREGTLVHISTFSLEQQLIAPVKLKVHKREKFFGSDFEFFTIL